MLKRLSKAKFVVLYLSLILVTTNCVQDDKIFHTQEQEEPLDLHLDKTIITVDAKDIPGLIQKVANQHKGFLPKLEPTSNTKNNGTSNSFGEIDTSIIKALEDLEGNRTYTFKIHPYQKEENIFYNFIMVTDDEATIERMYILKYTSDDGKAYSKDFNGTLEKYELDGTYKKGTYFQDGQGDGEDCMDCTEPPEDGDSEDDDSDTDANTAAQDNDGDNQSSGSSGGSSSSSSSSGPSSGPSDGGDGGGTGGEDTYTFAIRWTCNWSNTTHLAVNDCRKPELGGEFVYIMTRLSRTPNGDDLLPCCDDDDVVVMEDEDPCEKIQEQITNEDFVDKVEILRDSLNIKNEIGFNQLKDGSFSEIAQSNSNHQLFTPYNPNVVGFLHTHINDYETGKFHPVTGNPLIKKVYRMPSPGDILTFLNTVANASANAINVNDIYVSTYSSTGNYTLRFTGDPESIDLSGYNKHLLNTDYINSFKKYNKKEKAFLKFLKEKINIPGIELYEIENNGTVKRKFLKENGNLDSETCD